ncbi:hypothetical protein SKAU_G00297790 [Synaphobranchus kaupii]|uniref:PHD-type domain-containing protein n=1 Tax=Synaphobranchus kaupii TaxID=118154 RepID=A0A9Q1EV50_SYNKA|nr:hypothetical protein SKAU_G00297790 [Synaphobranchus kaupii]
MDRLSQGQSMDDGLPQSPSTCSLPTVFDLSRRRRPSPVSPTPVGALHPGRAPRWCGGLSSRGVEPPQNSSAAYRNSLSAPPDNAFSNTTVTLSYINRSHVLSAQDQIAPKVHTVASQAGGLSRRSLPESKPEQFDAYSEAPPTERARGFAQSSPGFNGKRDFLRPRAARLQRRHVDGVAEGGSRFSQQHGEGDRDRGVLNGVKGDFWDLESCVGKCSSAEQRQSGGETSHRGKRTSRKLYSSLNEDYMSALEDPPSPAVSSGDEMEDVSILPQALSSPGSDSPFAEEDLADAAGVNSAEGDGCRFTVQFVEVSSSSGDSCSDDSDVIEVPVTSVTNSLASFPAGLPRPFRRSPAREECLLKKTQLTHAVKKAEGKASEGRLNGNTLGEERAVGWKTRPPHARLGAARPNVIVGNVTSLRSRASGHSRSVEQCAEPESLTDSPAVSHGGDSVGDSPCDSEAEAAAVLREGDGGDLRSGRRKSRRSASSGSEDESFSKSHNCSTLPPGPSAPNKVETPQSRPQKDAAKTAKGAEKQRGSHAKRTGAGGKAAGKSAGGKKRKKRVRASQSSAFAPREPEIKLKYATYREEKRDVRAVAFAPYVHLDKKESSGCTVVNYPEEETGGLKKGTARHIGVGLATGTVPATSYLELGRLDAEGRRQREESCCVCGGSANALDLGDLHGPYRPHAGRQGPRGPAEPPGPKDEEACSDSDSSYDGRGGKYGRVQEGGARPRGLSHGTKRDAALAAQCRWVCDDDSLQGPLAKTSWPGSNHSEQRGTPTKALDVREFWLHEDCGVWSMGVFLVRGKLYGLEEAVRLAQQTVCSTCHELGATLGCFFKSCPNKYHYRCAVHSDCVLNEENFTMKCTKHKNKSVKGVSRTENSSVRVLGCGVCISAEMDHMSAADDAVPSLTAVAMTTAEDGARRQAPEQRKPNSVNLKEFHRVPGIPLADSLFS